MTMAQRFMGCGDCSLLTGYGSGRLGLRAEIGIGWSVKLGGWYEEFACGCELGWCWRLGWVGGRLR